MVRSLKPDHVGHLLKSGMFLRVRAFPALRIPDFKTAAPANECNFALQSELLAKILWQDETPLPVGCTVFRARMELA